MGKRYRNGWWLEEKYANEGLTQVEIAAECDVSPRTIRKYMKRYGIETRSVSGENHPLSGEERDEEIRQRISRSLAGRELSEEWRTNISDGLSGRAIPSEMRAKISDSLEGTERSLETRKPMSDSTSGEKNPNWKGGYSRYYGSGWGPAREKAQNRDQVCQSCGHDGSDRRLEVHHIVPVRAFIEDSDMERSDARALENLVLLCNRCHTKADFGCLSFETGLAEDELPGER